MIKRVLGKLKKIPLNTILAWFMRLSLVGLIFWSFIEGDYLITMGALLASFLSIAPAILRRNYKITLPFYLEFLIVVGLYMHVFLGEFRLFYDVYPWWDKAMHLLGTFIISILGFLVVYTLHYTKKVRLSLPLIGFFTVVFGLAIGAFWEILEFLLDTFLGTNAQRSLTNTMVDLIVDLLSSIVTGLFGVIYVKHKKSEGRKKLTKPMEDIFNLKKIKKRLKK